MSRIGHLVVREIREALPATIFFLCLFHMIALTRAVFLADFSLTALRAAGATVAALLVAKAILVVEALPVARLVPGPRLVHVLWKTLLYSVVVLLFRLAEEIAPLAWKHGGLAAAAAVMSAEVSWPLFGLLALWIVGGLLLYCLAAELVQAIGPARVKEMLLGARDPAG